MRMQPQGAVLEGSEEAVEKAKEMIQSIIISHMEFQKTISVPIKFFGLVLGKQGTTIQSIQRQTNTKITLKGDVETALAHISGATEEQCNAAEQIIFEIVSKGCYMSEKTVPFPIVYYASVIGSSGIRIKSIQRQTHTKITLKEGVDTALAHISSATEEQCNAAEQMILEIVSKPLEKLGKKLAFVDGACVGENNEFELEECRDDSNNIMYKLIMQGDKLDEVKEVDYLPMLEESMLEVLREIYKENQESQNLRTDMWCHFSHAYICNVDEADVGKVYQIEDVNENLQKQEDMWKVKLKEGIETPELVDLERILSKEPYKVEPNTRFEYRFSCPSGREVRLKAFSVDSNFDPDGVSFEKYKSPIPMKNVLAVESTESIKYYLCAPSTVRLKVDICFPYLTLDCRLVVRTSLKETSTVRDEEEDQILIDSLNDNLKLKEGKLELQEDLLPDGFDIIYWRESKRRTYPYKYDNVDFNVIISEEESRKHTMENDIRIKTDVHLHCDEWDQQLDQEDWEPEAIVSKLPDFLNFVRAIQSNINP